MGNIGLEMGRRWSRLGMAVARLEVRWVLVMLPRTLWDLVLWKRILVTHEC